jgi:hypothetical protein
MMIHSAYRNSHPQNEKIWTHFSSPLTERNKRGRFVLSEITTSFEEKKRGEEGKGRKRWLCLSYRKRNITGFLSSIMID